LSAAVSSDSLERLRLNTISKCHRNDSCLHEWVFSFGFISEVHTATVILKKSVVVVVVVVVVVDG
jgi:hypothetical protein